MNIDQIKDVFQALSNIASLEEQLQQQQQQQQQIRRGSAVSGTMGSPMQALENEREKLSLALILSGVTLDSQQGKSRKGFGYGRGQSRGQNRKERGDKLHSPLPDSTSSASSSGSASADDDGDFDLDHTDTSAGTNVAFAGGEDIDSAQLEAERFISSVTPEFDNWSFESIHHWQKLWVLLLVYVLPKCPRVNNQNFRSEYRSNSVSRLQSQYRPMLRLVFEYYVNAVQMQTKKDVGTCIDSNTFIKILSDAQWLQGPLDKKSALLIFSLSQQPIDISDSGEGASTINGIGIGSGGGSVGGDGNNNDGNNDGGDSSGPGLDMDIKTGTKLQSSLQQQPLQLQLVKKKDEMMIYQEFLESLALIACYRIPNPYMGLASKLEQFFKVDLTAFAITKGYGTN